MIHHWLTVLAGVSSCWCTYVMLQGGNLQHVVLWGRQVGESSSAYEVGCSCIGSSPFWQVLCSVRCSRQHA